MAHEGLGTQEALLHVTSGAPDWGPDEDLPSPSPWPFGLAETYAERQADREDAIVVLESQNGYELPCSGYTELFFEEPAEAKRLCRGCPERWDCLAGAIKRGEGFGVWGGIQAGTKMWSRLRALPESASLDGLARAVTSAEAARSEARRRPNLAA